MRVRFRPGGGVSPLPLSLSHTLTRTNPKPLPESLWSEREKKKSINASVGLPWLEHGTVSLLSGCVNLFCLVCCESVSRLKHSSMPASFFFFTFFPLLFRLPVTLQCTVVLMFPISVSGEASSQRRMEYGVTHRRTNSAGCFRWCGVERSGGSGGSALRDGNLSVLRQASEGARWCRADLSSLSSFSASENFLLFPRWG